jgi:aminopeptidase N/puromycin-sensitive aminopeptidase
VSLFVLAAFTSTAQHLPQGVRPEHYTLQLTPDLKAATFSGDESIDITLARPSNSITLNAAEIKFQEVTASGNFKTQPATVSLDPDKEQATLQFAQPMPAGRATLHIRYTGILNGELRGFYLSKTAKRNYAVTQFEPTDARRAFPSFDEPAYKATYTATLIVDSGDTAISNTNIVSDKAGPLPGKHTIKFATTPKMSTYLVAFLVGDFQCVAGESDGVPIRACATPDKVQLGKFAVTAAEYILHFYNDYFGIKYPLPKLDMIALPDFEAGAMENFGAITYRETALLVDEKTAPISAKKNVALVVAHEMAHQWFGDLVTMQWWDNIWLNEGFATWMERKPLIAWKPEWKVTQDEATELGKALDYDARTTTRTIRAKAETPSEINEMFDIISYEKSGAVLNMVENYLGVETFRRGVHNYLASHLYSNATAEDFWGAQTKASQKPIDKIMSSFVDQPGVPLLTFAEPEKDKVDVSQQRFFLSATAKADTTQSWSLPVCFQQAEGKDCEIVSSPRQALPAPDGPLFFANAGGKGYYRISYPPAVYQRIVAQVETSLTPEERITLTDNQWALLSSGRSSVGDYLDLVASLRNDSNAAVIGGAVSHVEVIASRIASDEDRRQLALWLQEQWKPAYEKVRAVRPDDPSDRRELRASLLRALGTIGEDQSVLPEANQITDQWLKDPSSVDPTLASAARLVATYHGDSALYDRFLNLAKTSQDPIIRDGALLSLANFRAPTLVKRTLDYAVSGQVRNQDAVFVLVRLITARQTREMAWDYIQNHWDQVNKQMTTMAGPRLVAATGSFCTAESREHVTSFFATHKMTAADRALKRAADSIDDCIDLKSRQEPKLREWLAGRTESSR